LSQHPPSLLSALLAILCLALLGSVAVNQRTHRLRNGYLAYRLTEEVGKLENELRWLQGRHRALLTPSSLEVRALRIGLGTRHGVGAVVRAPVTATGGVGQ